MHSGGGSIKPAMRPVLDPELELEIMWIQILYLLGAG